MTLVKSDVLTPERKKNILPSSIIYTYTRVVVCISRTPPPPPRYVVIMSRGEGYATSVEWNRSCTQYIMYYTYTKGCAELLGLRRARVWFRYGRRGGGDDIMILLARVTDRIRAKNTGSATCRWKNPGGVHIAASRHGVRGVTTSMARCWEIDMCSRGVNKKYYSARFVFICDTQRYYVYIFIYFFHPILVGQLSSWILNYGPTAVLLRLYRSTVCTRSLEYLCAPRGAYMTLWYRYRADIIIITRPRV